MENCNANSYIGIEEPDISSGESTPEPPAPFVPKYYVKFTDCVTKDGDSIKFSIQIFQNTLLIHVIERVYEDFEYLEHCVFTDQPSHGLIVPPLPLLDAVDAEAAVAHTKKHMGKASKLMLGDDFRKDCFQLQKYLNVLLVHPVFGQSPRLQEFLLNKVAPPRIKLKQGLISKLSSTLEARKVSHPDCEDFFQRERDNVQKYNPAIKEFSQNFDKITFAQIKILHQYEQMVIALRLNPNLDSGPLNFYNLNHVFLNCVDQTKSELDDKIVSDDLEVGCIFNFWKKYVEAEHTMLLTRTSLMIDYQTCNRALDKAKPNRKHIGIGVKPWYELTAPADLLSSGQFKHQPHITSLTVRAEIAQKNSEEAFERCSDAARKEIKRFHMLRTNELMKTVLWYMHHQISSTKRNITVLSSALAKIKEIPVKR